LNLNTVSGTFMANPKTMHNQFAFIVLANLEKNWLGLESQVLQPLLDSTVLEHLIKQLEECSLPIVVSVQGNPKTCEIPQSILEKDSCTILWTETDSESSRLEEALESVHCDRGIRVGADNPIFGSELLNKMLGEYEEGQYFFTSGFPTGIQLEVFDSTVLERCLATRSKKRIQQIIQYELSLELTVRRFQPWTRLLMRPDTRWTCGTPRDRKQIEKLLTISPKESSLEEKMKDWVSNKLDVLSPPVSINIEPTNKCNLNCVMCPRDEMTRSLGNMPLDTFYKVIGDAVEMGVQNIILHGYGEPFISADLFEMIRHIREETNLHVRVNTNGLYLSERRIRKLLDCPPHHLNVSIDGATAETYEKIRINGNYNKLEGFIENFIKIRHEDFPNADLKFSLQFIRMEETEHEVELFRTRWEGLVDEIAIPPVHNWAGTYEERGKRSQSSLERFPCRELWRTIVVSYSGNTTICCNVINDDPMMGNVNEKSLNEIWNSREYEEFRNIHLEGTFEKMDKCKDCDLWKTIG